MRRTEPPASQEPVVSLVLSDIMAEWGQRVLSRASELALFGFPPPGHPQ
jgi:hypothetical protein